MFEGDSGCAIDASLLERPEHAGRKCESIVSVTGYRGCGFPFFGDVHHARSLNDRALADELRDACTTMALNLGGWDKKRKAKNGKFERSQLQREAADWVRAT